MGKVLLFNFSNMVVMASEAKSPSPSLLSSRLLSTHPLGPPFPSFLPFQGWGVNSRLFRYWAISLNHSPVFIIHFNRYAIILIYGVQCDI